MLDCARATSAAAAAAAVALLLLLGVCDICSTAVMRRPSIEATRRAMCSACVVCCAMCVWRTEKEQHTEHPRQHAAVVDKAHGSAMFRLHPCLLYTSPSPRDKRQSRMPSSA